jgi:hypothetical protein
MLHEAVWQASWGLQTTGTVAQHPEAGFMTPSVQGLGFEQLVGVMQLPHEQIPQQSTHPVTLSEHAVAERDCTMPES